MDLRGASALALCALAGCQVVFGLPEVKGTNASPRTLVIDNSSSATDLGDLPVLVRLTSDTVDYVAVADPASDLRFTDAAGGDLPFDVDHWDPGGESIVWVLVHAIPARSTTTELRMYFGPDAHGHADAHAVWHEYALVFHGDALADAANTADVATMHADATGMLPTPALAAFGEGVQFEPLAGQRVEFSQSAGVLAGWSQLTLDLWIYADYPDQDLGGLERQLFDKSFGGAHNTRLRNSIDGQPSPFVLQTDFSFHSTAGDVNMYPYFYVPHSMWFHLAYAYDGQTLWQYRDGVVIDVASNPLASPLVDDRSGPFLLGGGNPARALIDEVRISPAYHTPDWMYAEHLAMTGHLVTFR